MARTGVVDLHLKRMFLDTKLVENLIGKKNAKAIRIAMSRVRLRAMHSMKTKGRARRAPKRGKGKAFERWQNEVMNEPVSPPGSPPFVHSDSPVESLRNIWFALDSVGRDLQGVVGPLALNKQQTFNGMMMSGTVPRLHEQGGKAGIREKLVGKHWMPQGRRRARPGQPTRTRIATYPKRPFMVPALEKEAPKFPALWSASAA